MEILSYLEKMNWHTIIGMFAICWYFTYDLRKSMERIDIDMKEQGKRIDAQGQRTDKLYQMFIDLLKDQRR